jgi:hypothetical protein
MSPERARTPDWRDAEAYAPLLEVDRSGFAWEWLRRDGGYREAVVGGDAGRWGLHAFEAPDWDAIAARPVWRREAYPYVLEAAAEDEGRDEDRLDLERLRRLLTLVRSIGGIEHLLLSDGRRGIRIDIASGTVGAGPVRLSYRLAGLAGAQAPLLVLRQLLALWRTGEFSRALHPEEPRAARWILVLRAGDALAAGASQREIAECLLGREAAQRRWRVETSSLRSRVQRLAREARRMAAGGYRELLAGG